MKKVIYSPEYKDKLIRLRNYLDSNYDQQTRKKVFAKIDHHIQLLRSQNRLGVSLRERYGIDCDYYYIYVANNLVFYRIEEDSIRILDMYHEREDSIIKFLGRRSRLHEHSEE